MSGVVIRPMRAGDVAPAQRIFQHAFGTHLGADDLDRFRADIGMIGLRQASYPNLCWVAEIEDRLVGSVILNDLGSHWVFGPLTVAPSHWNGGIARLLTQHAVTAARAASPAHLGLFTYPDSPKHLELYRRFGFWPGHLTAVFRKVPVAGAMPECGSSRPRAEVVQRCREVADQVFPGLDPAKEALMVLDHDVGEVILTETGFAICHSGPGSEAGSRKAYVKLAVLAPGRNGRARLADLVAEVEHWAAAKGAETVDIGCNTRRRAAYATLADGGWRIAIQGLAMHLDDRPALVGKSALVLDDWR